MLLRRSSPVGTIGQITREMDRVFSGLLNDADGFFLRSPAYPAINVWEEGDDFLAEVEVPGFKMNDLEVEVLDNELTLKGKRVTEVEQNATFHRRERSATEFERSITLPVSIDAEKVEATLKNGVLTIKLPKAEVARARKITVKTLEQ